MVARELTKIHQSLYRGTAAQVEEQIGAPRGEFTVVLGPWRLPADTEAPLTPAMALIEFGVITESMGLGRRAALAEMARRHGIRPNEAYLLLERAKSVGNDQ